MDTVTRADWVQKYMEHGFNYVDAVKAYDVMVTVMSDAVVSGSRVTIGRVGAIVPQQAPARTVRMGFTRTAAGVSKASREYFLGKRLKWTFRVFKTFLREQPLDWGQSRPR